MSQIILDFTEEKITGEPTREELIQSIRLLKQMLRERLTQEYLAFRHQAEILGIPLETLGGSTGGGGHAPVFVHPHNPSLVWSGRGRRPRWVREFFPSSGDTDETRDKLRAASDVTAVAAGQSHQETVSSEATGTSSPVSAPADEPAGNGSEEAGPVPASGTTPPDVSADLSVKAETASPAETSPSESPAATPSAAATAEEPPRRSSNRRTTSRPAAPEETNNPSS